MTSTLLLLSRVLVAFSSVDGVVKVKRGKNWHRGSTENKTKHKFRNKKLPDTII